MLKIGSKGESVRTLQSQLNSLGHSSGYSAGKVDGIFGKNTNAAVKKFQQENGLKVDGIVGPETSKALNNKMSSSSPKAQPKETAKPSPLLDGHLFTGEYTPEEIEKHMKEIYKKAPEQIKIRDKNTGTRIKNSTEYLITHYTGERQ